MAAVGGRVKWENGELLLTAGRLAITIGDYDYDYDYDYEHEHEHE
ncbi:MAG: hypothetical protein SGI88_16855 [Candidatus Hydrogenedentes bacterium]|nr:hypothetical protein [Candidatus Hydrogenedentota bacterium]